MASYCIIIYSLITLTFGQNQRQTQGSVVGRSCNENPECGTGAYCDDTKRCSCLSTYTDIGAYCWLKINPDQGGCIRTKQCSAVWPDAYCSSGTCKCGNNQPSAATRDGRICVNYGRCPVNGAHTMYRAPLSGEIANCGAKQQQLDGVCPAPSYDCICTDSACQNNGICCPSRAIACIQAADQGKTGLGGGGFSTRYYYNTITGNCERFKYRGSGGNANNFLTRDQCESYCNQACQRGNPLWTIATPGQKGQVVYCSTNSRTACNGNSNFECYTIDHGSTSMCCPTVNFVCSKSGGLSYGFYPPAPTNFDPGYTPGFSTSASVQRWYYDTDLSRCASFTYLGAGGNFNNFLSESHCSSYCAKALCEAGEPLKDQGGVNNLNCGTTSCPGTHICRNSVCCPRKQTVCSRPKQAGSCANFVNRWWYNAGTGNCEQFLYSGCQGNDNRFNTFTECQNFCRDLRVEPQCVQGRASKDANNNFIICQGNDAKITNCPANFQCYYDGNTWGCCPTQAYTCALPDDSGTSCGGPTVSRWYYNSAQRRCETFSYNGCDGNSNNFAMQSDCEDYCGVGGCPDSGTPFRQSNGQFLTCATNSNQCPANYYCTTVRIGSSTTSIKAQFCCANRAAVCRLPRIEGVPCSSSPLTRWFFNRITRACESFQFRGCTGNRNNFATKAQCLSYCNSADCPTGQVSLIDSTTNILVTCDVGTSCPFNGYSCVHSNLFDIGLCCGSTADPDLCPASMSAYIDSFTNSPRTCQPNVDLSCPASYACWFAVRRGQYFCCGTPGQTLCPNGGVPWINPATNVMQVCTPGNNAICENAGLGYNCQSRRVTVGGILSVTGTCCSPPTGVDSSVCGAGFTVLQLNKQNAKCHPVTANICPSPSVCRQNPRKSNEHFCCTQTGVIPGSQVCGSTRTPYTINGNPVVCSAGSKDLNCPSPYQCILYTPSNAFYCCSGYIQPQGSCPPGSSILTINGAVERCSPNAGCRMGYYCQYLTTSGGYVCCSYQTTVSPQNVCPGVSIVLTVGGVIQRCSPMAGCQLGYYCQFSAVVDNYVCCTQTTPVTTTAPPQSICPAGSEVLTHSGVIQRCSPIGGCQPGYYCQFSTLAGEYVCCKDTVQSTTPVTTLAPLTPPPTLAPALNPCPNDLVSARDKLGRPVPCTGNICLRPGFQCTFTNTGNWCCTIGTVISAIVTAPQGDNYGCSVGVSFLYPGTTLPLICHSTGNCPPGYVCRASNRIPGQNQCCSLVLSRRKNTLKTNFKNRLDFWYQR